MSDYLTMAELENKTLKEIYSYAKDFKIPYYSKMNKKELVFICDPCASRKTRLLLHGRDS
jgi:transcription termination factor Rho